MTNDPITVKVDPDSELARALDAAAATPVVLERDGTRYRVRPEDDDPWATYDPAKLRVALRKAAGTITPEEAERLKADLYRAREEGTRPLDRP